MPKWTPEQIDAIEKDGTNIIVSAGAGSGKTAVLSERVLYKLKKGIHIEELLILTFTRAAAEEMKDRIRKKIKKDVSLKRELDAIDSAYITTFDSFALSVVKKYHYLLNIPKDISIADDSIIRIEKKRILDEVFLESYASHDENFESLIKRFCVKSDTYIRDAIMSLIEKVDGLIDKDSFIDRLDKYFYSEDYFINIIKLYEQFIIELKKYVRLELENMSFYFESDYVSKIESIILPLLNTNGLDELLLFSEIKLPPVPRGTSDEAKAKKTSLKKALDELLSCIKFKSISDIKKDLLSTQNTTAAICEIIKKYFKILKIYKDQNNIYTFYDIADLAIKVLKENEQARLELRDSFKEIMIDEYQDTNDIQEAFISLIANNNVYMVGDIKQSIYRFRGSNPIIFKEKYDSFAKGLNGTKIDLVRNFRSRGEVIDDINRIFNLLMDDDLGGAKYYESHEMIYGNTLYDTQKMKSFGYNFEVLEYVNPKESSYSNAEVEIFAIAKDIKKKISQHLEVYDKETGKLRPVTYNDFVIILDRSKYFDLFKKIFEYLDIPLTILKDGKLNSSTDLLIIKNIIDFIIRIKTKDFGLEFKYDFLSIGRSFLYEYTDEYLFEVITENRIKETSIFEDFSRIKNYRSKSANDILEDILDITNFYQKISKIGDYDNINVRLSAIYDIAEYLSDRGYSIEDFRDYLEEIIKNDYEIKYAEFNSSLNSVNILTIHKSKGLEYPICYYADLDHDFNTLELKGKFILDSKYGIISPINREDEKDSICKTLYKNEYIKQEISEKIRLFYVALTRAREKIIMVLPENNIEKPEKNENGTIELVRRLSIRSIADFLYICKPYLKNNFKNIDLSDLNLSKDYLYSKNKISDYKKSDIEFKVEEIHIENDVVDDNTFSKSNTKILSKDEISKMEFGTLVHEALEYSDFTNYQGSDSFIDERVQKLLNNPLFKNIKDAKIYKEYEFYYQKNNINYHGIIDLMLEYDSHIDIIDYKLQDITDENYRKQINGYKDYIKTISNKEINAYLYSIIDASIVEI